MTTKIQTITAAEAKPGVAYFVVKSQKKAIIDAIVEVCPCNDLLSPHFTLSEDIEIMKQGNSPCEFSQITVIELGEI